MSPTVLDRWQQRSSALFAQKKELINTILYLNTAFSMIDKMFQNEIEQNAVVAGFFSRLCCLAGPRRVPATATRPNPDDHIINTILGL
jgi:hypothetical protein